MMRLTLALALFSLVTTGCSKSNENSPASADTAKVAEPIFSTVTETRTATETRTDTATLTNTETRTETATVTATVTNTQTNTVSSVSTFTAFTTITNVQISTVTVTETQVATETKTIDEGKYRSQTCFFNALASESAERRIYTRSTIRFGANGRGSNSFELFEDEECRHSAMRARVQIRYTVTQYFERLLLIAITQYNDPKDKKNVARYWIPALKTDAGLLFDIDGAQEARAPFLQEPSEEELKSLLDGMEKRAVVFEKAEKKK